MSAERRAATTSADFARLRWRCRRGMHELDGVLESFAQAALQTLDADDLARFERILDLPDPELVAYLLGRSAPADPDVSRLIERIRSSRRPAS
jgi:antitoxin CptB